MVAGTSNKILEALSFFDLHNKNNQTNSSGKKNSTIKLSGLNIFRKYAKNFKLNVVLVVVFVLETKAHLYRLYFEAIQFFYSKIYQTFAQ